MPEIYLKTDIDRGRVEGMAAAGMPHERIAEIMRIDAATLHRHYQRELSLAKEIADTQVIQTLFKQATGGGNWREAVPAATIFWVKARQHWRTVDQVEVGGAGEFDKMSDAELRELIKREMGEGADKGIDSQDKPVRLAPVK
jgi:hypothetical protein